MVSRLHFVVLVGFVFTSCVLKENRSIQDAGISGAYVREYSFKVINPESGIEIGFATIRDTVLIEKTENGYHVANIKWRLNDYDKEGWQNREHTDDRPLADYMAIFLPRDSILVAESFPTIYLKGNPLTLYKGAKGTNPYQIVPRH